MMRISKAVLALRTAEKVAAGFFAYALLASWFFPINFEQRLTVAALNVIAVGVMVLLACHANRAGNSFLALVRDWLPCVLIILAYRESGLFLSPDVTHHLDYLFIGWDRALLKSAWLQSFVSPGSPWFKRCIELAYLLVYPFVPLGFAAVSFRTRRLGDARSDGTFDAAKSADRYWTAVLLAVLTSYALFPFFPLTPPRLLFRDFPAAAGLTQSAGLAGSASESLLRKMNLWILDRYSVQACIFPSGHVAGAVATALAVRAQRARLGTIFIFAAASIAASTVFGRYHYTADALAGALIGVASFAVSVQSHKRHLNGKRI